MVISVIPSKHKQNNNRNTTNNTTEYPVKIDGNYIGWI